MKTPILIGLLMISVFLSLTSCTKDIDENLNEPAKPYFKAIFNGEVSEIYADMPLNGSFEVHLVGQKSATPLKSLRFMEEGYTLPLHRIQINDQEITTNPLILDGRQSYSVEMMVKIMSHEELGLRKKYTIVLEDTDGNTNSVVLWLNTLVVHPEMLISANEDHEVIVPPGSLVSVKINVKKGSYSLSSVSVLLKNDFKCHTVTPEQVNPEDLYFGYSMIHVDSNPIILNKADSKGFDKTLFIRVPSLPGLYAYCIMLQDSNKNVVDDWFKVKVMDFEDSFIIPSSDVK